MKHTLTRAAALFSAAFALAGCTKIIPPEEAYCVRTAPHSFRVVDNVYRPGVALFDATDLITGDGRSFKGLANSPDGNKKALNADLDDKICKVYHGFLSRTYTIR